MKLLRLTYYSVLDSMTHSKDKEMDLKDSLVVQFAQSIKRAYLNDQLKNRKLEQSIKNIEDLDEKSRPARFGRRKKDSDINEVVASKIVLLKRVANPPPSTTDEQDVKIEAPEEKENVYCKAYKQLLLQARKHHSAFFVKLCAMLKGSNPNLILKRDFAANYTKLIPFRGCNPIVGEHTEMYNVSPF